ncbi:MAG: hypothetical protein FLDDKLPJ_02075 [Phycisphaerae bacterium]|nr:hypothetical protein [Phycisphaerae bacterium]
MKLNLQLVSICVMLATSIALSQQSAPSGGGSLPAVPDGSEDQFPAGFIATRAELNELLADGTTDDFETFVIADGDAVDLGVFDLNDTTVARGQGPGLVHDGAIYFSAQHLFWLGRNFNGMPTRTLAANSLSMGLAYDHPAQVMGVDLHSISGSGEITTVEVYSPTGQLLGSTNVTLPEDGSGAFVGFRHEEGIGAIQLINHRAAVVLNDHAYGAVCGSDGCNGTELLSAKVREKSCGCQVQAILKRGTPGLFYAFKMPDGTCVSAEANRRGKAKVKQCPSRGGKVFVHSCGLEARVRCP